MPQRLEKGALFSASASIVTRPEVSEGGPAITNLIQGVAREEAHIHRQIEVSMDLSLSPS